MKDSLHRRPILPAWIIMVVAIVSLAIVALGIHYYKSQKRHLRLALEKELLTVAQFKVNQVQQWRSELLTDTDSVANNPFLENNINNVISGDAEAVSRMRAYFEDLRRIYRYADVTLADANGNVLLSTSGDLGIDAYRKRLVTATVLSRQSMLSELHAIEGGTTPVLDSVAPVFAGKSHVQPPVAAIILASDARYNLYPLMQSWPVPSRTAETLLVRREKDSVLFLNELRHLSGTALALRIPLARDDLPAVQALMGRQGIFEGTDYRDVRVISALAPVPKSSWQLVAKMDSDEAFEMIHTRLALIIALTVAGLAFVVCSILLSWQFFQKHHYKLQYELEAERQALRTHYENMVKFANDSILLSDEGQRIVEANDRALDTYGYSHEQMGAMKLTDIVAPEKLFLLPVQLEQIAEKQAFVFESVHQRKDGSQFPVEISARWIKAEDKRFLQQIIRDITQRKAAEQALRQSEEQFRRVIEHVHDAIIVDDIEGSIVFANKQFLDLFAVPSEKATSLRLEDYVAPEYRAELRERHNRRKRGEQAPSHFECEGLRADGQRVFLEVDVVSIRDGDGKIVGTQSAIRDITERHKAEQALRETKQRLSDIIDHSTNLFYLHTTDHVLQYISPQCRDYFDCEPEEAKVLWTQFLTDNPANSIGMKRTQKAIDTGQPQPPYELELVGMKGRIIWVEVHEAPVVENGQTVAVVGSLTDITERRNKHLELEKHHDFLQTVIKSIPDPLYIIDVKTYKVLMSNRSDAPEYATCFSAVRGLTVPCSQAPDGCLCPIEEVTRTRRPVVFEYKYRTEDGQIRQHEVRGYPIFDEKGNVSQIIEYCLDISARKYAEKQQAQLSQAVEQTAESIVITDTDANILYVNPAFERITGYTSEEVIGKNPRILRGHHESNEFYEDLWNTILKGGVWKGHFQNKRKDGSILEEEAIISPVRDDRGKIVNFIAVKRDVTREWQMQEQLRQAQKMEAVGRLAGGIAHDFNNILAVILGYAELLRASTPANTPKRSHLDQICTAAERAAVLTRQLLAFGRKQLLQPRVLDLNSVISGVSKMLGRLIGEDVNLITRLSPNLAPVRIDPGQIEQLLMNLAINSRDAMPGGGTLIVETSNVHLDESYAMNYPDVKPGMFALLSVTDTGSGMTEEVQAHLFEPFYTTKEIGKGTGLGLATCYGIVKQSGGHINVYSKVGAGTTFNIYLPQVKAELDKAAYSMDLEDAPKGDETILLVEDDNSLRSMAALVLKEMGYRVIEARNGWDALNQAKQFDDGQINLLLTDVVMPEMDGKKLAENLQKQFPGMNILYTSGYPTDILAPQGVLDKGIAFLEKPYAPTTLLRKVRDVLESGTLRKIKAS